MKILYYLKPKKLSFLVVPFSFFTLFKDHCQNGVASSTANSDLALTWGGMLHLIRGRGLEEPHRAQALSRGRASGIL